MKRVLLSGILLLGGLLQATDEVQGSAQFKEGSMPVRASVLQTVIVPYLESQDCSIQLQSAQDEIQFLIDNCNNSACESLLDETRDLLSATDSLLESTQDALDSANSIIDEAEVLLTGTAIPEASSIDALASRLGVVSKYAGVNPTEPLLAQINTGLIPYLQAALTKLGEVSPVKQIAMGYDHAVVLLENGTVYAAGKNNKGQLGNGTNADSNVFVKMTNNNVNIVAVAAGYEFTYALKSDNTVYATGLNSSGQLGNGTNIDTNVLVAMTTNNSAIVALTAGDSHGAVLKANGTIYATGLNSSGQLGNGTNIDTNVLVAMTTNNSAIVAITAGYAHTAALKADGTVYATGENSSGQLGNGTNANTDVLVAMTTNNSNISAIAAGDVHTVALKANGTVYATGSNDDGQLGNGTNTTSNVLVLMTTNNTNITAIAAGEIHTVVLKAGGTVYATGGNDNGQLGNGTTGGTTNTLAAMTGSNNSNIAALARGSESNFSLVLQSDGTVYSTGNNFDGQLGIGSNSDVNVLTQIASFLSLGA